MHGWRTVGLAIVAGGLAACSTGPIHENKPVDAEAMKLLKSRVLNLRESGMVDARGRLQFGGRWDAPATVTVPMELRGGLPSIQCRINGGAPQWIILDTGSQGCVMEASTALAHQVEVVDPALTNLHLMGILGTESVLMGVPANLSIGEWKVDNFPFLVRTQKNALLVSWPFWRVDLHYDVLGMNMIRSMCSYMTIDYQARSVTFGFKGAFVPRGKGKAWRAPLFFDKQLPHVLLSSNGRPWKALIDSGATAPAELDQATASRLGVLASARTVNGSRLGVGSSSKPEASSQRIVKIPNIDKLGPKIVNVPATIVGDFNKIGTGLMLPFRVTFDFKAQRLWLEDPH